MSDVFVSYKAEDRRRVEPLVRALEADGFSVWWDGRIGAGDQWREAILENLDSAACVVVVWSPRSTGPEGEFVRDEATRAKRRNAYLPVCIDKAEPPLGFGETQALSLHGWRGNSSDARFRAVADAIRRRIGSRAPRKSEEQTHRWSRRSALIAGAGAGAVALAGGGWWLSHGERGDRSIAVLPFENLSGDPGQNYFSDGIAEELRAALARVAGLKVVSRTSSEAVRSDDATTAASKLHVGNILTGSVRRSAAMLRISAQLVDGSDGTERWSEQYDRPAGDALAIQSDIARQVVAALAMRLSAAAGGRLTAGGTTNAQANDLYLKALAARQGSHTAPNMRAAIQYADAAIAIDPQYADAYALKAIATSELTSGFASTATEVRQGLAQAEAAAARALSLSPDLPVAHAALALVASSRINFVRALTEYRKAAENSSDALILGDFGRFMAQIGFTAQAHEVAKRVIALDPLNARSYSIDSSAFYLSRNYEAAIDAIRKALFYSPAVPVALSQLGDALLNLGRYDEARQTYAQMPADDVFRIVGEGILNKRLGNDAAAQQAAERLVQVYGVTASYQLMELLAQRGDKDAAFAAFEQAIALPDSGLIELLVDPFIDPLRGDPRFAALRAKIAFPPGAPG